MFNSQLTGNVKKYISSTIIFPEHEDNSNWFNSSQYINSFWPTSMQHKVYSFIMSKQHGTGAHNPTFFINKNYLWYYFLQQSWCTLPKNCFKWITSCAKYKMKTIKTLPYLKTLAKISHKCELKTIQRCTHFITTFQSYSYCCAEYIHGLCSIMPVHKEKEKREHENLTLIKNINLRYCNRCITCNLPLSEFQECME